MVRTTTKTTAPVAIPKITAFGNESGIEDKFRRGGGEGGAASNLLPSWKLGSAASSGAAEVVCVAGWMELVEVAGGEDNTLAKRGDASYGVEVADDGLVEPKGKGPKVGEDIPRSTRDKNPKRSFFYSLLLLSLRQHSVLLLPLVERSYRDVYKDGKRERQST
ncbi:hypothetical protein HPP92_024175 [Vanilla planifolia]|uniref:Uncharacterized protein n=1 Tax=Vanilla planifolia TaxID=51239 RepID=A0A835PUL9_VANPL|nr:hypothetical protein HPP92_024175 [Vanilla planifolia]